MIPKIIHRIHLGGNESQQVKDAWEISKKINIGWEHVTHTENDLDKFPISKKYLQYCDSYSLMSDLLRLEALYYWGGFYIDTDVIMVKSFDDLCKFDLPIIGFEDDLDLGSAVLGSPLKNIKILQALSELVLRIKQDLKEFGYVRYNGQVPVFGPRVITHIFKNSEESIKLDSDYFYPAPYFLHNKDGHIKKNESVLQYVERVNKYFTKNTYCVHAWSGTWLEGQH